MKYVADLHLHSKFSRAVSPSMTIPTLAEWGKKKGIKLLSTSDFTHPIWFNVLKEELVEDGTGFYKAKNASLDVRFVLGTELSCIYSQEGKLRRIHILVFAPDFPTVEKINQALSKRGKLGSDGRPIFGMGAKELTSILLGINPDCFIVPAHCLLPNSLIHTKEGVKSIDNIKVGDQVYTHENRGRKVTDVLVRQYKGEVISIRPWYFSLGLTTTPEHPFYALRVEKCSTKGDRCLPTDAHKAICRHEKYHNYKPEWIKAEDLKVGDVLVYPRFQNTTIIQKIPIDVSNAYENTDSTIYTGGSRGKLFPKFISIDKDFCRLLGYYLSEGYTNSRDEIGFTFSQSEKAYVEDVIGLMRKVLGITHHRIYVRKGGKGCEISFYSKLLVEFFTRNFYFSKPFRANNKTLPDWLLHLPTEYQSELLCGWWRGDKGYTSSYQLANAMKVICLRLGIIPSILKDTKEDHLLRGNHGHGDRVIKANNDNYVFSHLAFYEDRYGLLSDPAFKDNISKLSRKHGWIDKNYIYVPIRRIEKGYYEGEVYNLEVEKDNSYVAEFAAVHNCWTPWFALYGSNSGFDSIEECFGDLSKYIYAIETGLSSDPSMNWRLSELDTRAILSFSDAHSPAKVGREATIFEGELSYEGLIGAIRGTQGNKVVGTIEFFPEEGKYHFTGHRSCGVKQNPRETKEKGEICPVCQRRLTVGVMHRVEQLADRTEEQLELTKVGGWVRSQKLSRPPFRRLVPLQEIIAEALAATPSSQRVVAEFEKLARSLGSEIEVLLHSKREDIEKVSHPRIAEGVEKVREGNIIIDPGFDGVYGVVKIWPETKREARIDQPKSEKKLSKPKDENQPSLFG